MLRVAASIEYLFSLMIGYSLERLQTTVWQDSLCSYLFGGAISEGGRAHCEGDAFWGCAEATVVVGGDTDCVFLGFAYWLLSSSFSLGEVHSFKDRDGSLDGESSVLGLDCEGSMCWFGAFAAVGLADLVELSVGHSRQRLNLSCFSELLEALTLTSTESGELGEVAVARDVLEADVAKARGDLAAWPVIAVLFNLNLSEVLGIHLPETILQGGRGLGCSGDGASEECY